MSSNQQQIPSQQSKEDYNNASRRLRYLWLVFFAAMGMAGVAILGLSLLSFPAQAAQVGYYLLLSLGFLGLVLSTLAIFRASDSRKKKSTDE